MGSLRDDDEELKPIKKSPNVDVAETEIQTFDTQFSPPSSCGEKVKDGNVEELQLKQSTVPFVDTVPLEDDVFQTQFVKLGGETQVLDDPHCVETLCTQLIDECDEGNLCTQLMDEFDDEVVIDSDGEGTDKTELLSDTEVLSDGDSVRRAGGSSVDGEKMQCTFLCKHGEKGLMEETDTLTVDLRSSEVDVSPTTPLDQGTPESKPESLRRGFTSVRAASLRASGLAARSKAFSGTNYGSCCILNNSESLKRPAIEDNGISSIRDSPKIQEEDDQVNDLGKYNEKVKDLRNESKCRAGRSTVRKLFSEDTLAEDTGSMNNTNNAEGAADLPQLPAYDNDLAGLSYVDSQEPGEFSQAHALDFVDRFLKVNVVCDQEVEPGKITRGESVPVSSAKGSRSLAKTANLRSTVGEVGIYDWDDSREDEGGGDIFCKKKEEFFDSRGHGQRSFTRPRKPKGSKVDAFRDREERSNIHDKIISLADSESRLLLCNSKENGKTVPEAEMNIKKNLPHESNEQHNVNSLGELEAVVANVDMPDILNVGFDTQMAAEAMETLLYGEPLANHDANDAHQGLQNMSKGSCKSPSLEEMKDGVLPKRHSSLKRACPDSGISTRQSEKTKRTGARIGKEFVLSSQKHLRNVRKPFGAELAKAEHDRAKSNVDEHASTNGSENPDKIPFKITEQRQGKGALKRSRIGDVDKFQVTAKSSRCISVKRRHVQKETGTLTPIAQRTRKCMMLYQSERGENASKDSREEMNCLTKVGDPKDKRKRSGAGIDASKVLSAKKESSKLVSNQSRELEKVKPSHHEQSDPKSTAKTGGARIDVFSYPRGRRTRRNLSGQVNGSGDLDGPCKPSVGQEPFGQSITRQKRSKSNARTTCTDSDIKRKTRSSAYTCPVLPSSDRNLEVRISQQGTDKLGSRDAALHCDSVVMNGKIISKDQTGAKASKHSDRLSDVGPTSSAKGADGNSRLEASPGEIHKPSNSACTTPVNCTTPMNAASPLCMGNEYFKQSCKKNLSRSCLMKEINSLIATAPEPTTPLKDTRRRRDMANVRVLFSHHLDEDIIKQQKKILTRLGAFEASSISDATHFITDKFVRTRNMLEAIAFSKPVVTHLWLESCNQTSCFIDEKNYILRDAKKEKEFGFSMPISLARACQHPLLQGRRVLITPNTKPGKELIAGLVKAVHGQAVERICRSALKDDKSPDDLLVLSCEEDYAICVPLLEKGAAVYSSELLLNGIVIQKLEYERHRLFDDDVKRTRSTIWIRKDGSQFLPVTKHK